jgi:hypothetical protein
MPEILIYFLCGLAASAVVGLVFYYVMGGPSEAAARRVFGEQTGRLWGRSFRIMMFLMALIGGLSTQWYGCEGYKDYGHIAADRRLMLEKSTTQVTSAMSYAKWFVVLAAGVGAVAVAVLTPRKESVRPAGRIEPANDHSPQHE